jgi:hypothetical protein
MPDLDIICPFNETRASKHQVVHPYAVYSACILYIAFPMVQLAVWVEFS